MKKRYGHVEIPLQRIHLELTNVCEFNCRFCPKGVMTRRPGYMEAALAKSLLDEIGARGLCEKVTFHVMGEPTLHRDFFAILDHAGAAGVNVGLTTNGAGLGRGDLAAGLLARDLHQLDISLQTPDAASFRLRGAGRRSWEEYEERVLSFFCDYVAAHPRAIAKLRFLNTRFPRRGLEEKVGPVRVISSTKELREVFALWAGRIYERLGVPGEARAAALARIGRLSAARWNVVEICPNVFFETYMLDTWGNAYEDRPVHDAWAGYCYGMRDHFSVLCNGDVTLCCQDFDGRTAIGNVTGSSLLEVLSSDRVGRIVRGFRRGRLVHPYCRRCLGSTSRASWLVKPVVSVALLKTLKPFLYRRTRLMDRR